MPSDRDEGLVVVVGPAIDRAALLDLAKLALDRAVVLEAGEITLDREVQPAFDLLGLGLRGVQVLDLLFLDALVLVLVHPRRPVQIPISVWLWLPSQPPRWFGSLLADGLVVWPWKVIVKVPPVAPRPPFTSSASSAVGSRSSTCSS